LKLKKNKTIIIAEAGINHNGNINLAKQLIDIASKAGADYVKFQSFDVDNMMLKNTKIASYQKRNLKNNITQYKMLKKYQLEYISHKELSKYSKKKKLNF
jgi:N,N'-diacetyllegionaminate synthase